MLNNKILKRSEIKKVKFMNKFYFSNKSFLVVLSSIYGVNYYVSMQIFKILGLSLNIKMSKVNKNLMYSISDFFINYILVERGLKRYRNGIIMERKNSGNIRVIRLLSGLPIHGQRTHTNAKTVRSLFKNYKIEI